MDRRRKGYISPKEKPEIIAEEAKGINNELFKNCFQCQSPCHMYKSLNDTKNVERKKN